MTETKDSNEEWTDPSSPPPYGWKARFDYEFPQKREQKSEATLNQILQILPLIVRYLWYSIKFYIRGRRPIMDFLIMAKNKRKSGVPLGGIGSGSIGRGFKGEFWRFQMQPGVYKYSEVLANQFIASIYNDQGVCVYQKVLSTFHKPCFMSSLNKWDWSFPASKAHYTALYPQAWSVFEIKEDRLNIDIKLTCHQISPIIPHNYKDSSFPVCVFQWTVENKASSNCRVAIVMTVRDGDGDGSCHWKSSYKTTDKFELKNEQDSILGVTINQQIAGMRCDYSIASIKGASNTTVVERCGYFNPNGNGKRFWNSISSHDFETPQCERGAKHVGCAVKSQVMLEGRTSNSAICFAFSWNEPKIRFRGSVCDYMRYYTKFFSRPLEAGAEICSYALLNFNNWISEINNWQRPILEDKSLPNWYKSALFNELYYVSDGGSIWMLLNNDEEAKLPDSDPRKTYGRFAYLEGHEYKMYNTYDVHFYASFALAMLWPGLQKSVQYDMKDSITAEDKTQVWFLYDGEVGPRKVMDTVPHDVGDPDGDPFHLLNSYPVHDVSMWRDLNVKFVLQVYRDYKLMDDLQYLKDLYPLALTVMSKTQHWDPDSEGIIENGGFPDQTYDTWVMQGVSAYCGGLWLAAVAVVIKMSELFQDDLTNQKYRDILSRGKKAFHDKLWNGKYYLFDSCGDVNSDTIMADQLCGLWYLNMSEVDLEVFVPNNAKTALKTVFEYNVKKYYNGSQGAVNGMRPNGDIDRTAIQSEEIWTGVTYGLASLFISEGLTEEGLSIAEGLYETIFNKSGLGFSTPEALHGTDSIRAIGYMRPLSIWSMQHAFDLKKGSKIPSVK